MSLRVWLPLTGSLKNQGLSQVTLPTGAGTFTNGKLGQCLSGTSDMVYNFSDLSTMLSNGKKYSLACWIKLINNSSNNWIIKLGNNSCGLWYGYSSPRLVWNENDNGKRSATAIASDYTNWHHVVTVIDKTTITAIKTVNYVDGVLSDVAGWTFDGSSNVQPTGTTITLSPKAALLNDVRLYDHALSAQEVAKLARGLVVHLPLNRNGWGCDNLLRWSKVSTANKTSLNSISSAWNSLAIETIDGFPSYKYPSAQSPTWFNSGNWYASLKANTTYTYSAWIRD